MSDDQAQGALPRLAFVYSGLNSEDPPLLLAEAADGVAHLLWVLPDASEMPRAVLRMLRGLGNVVDVTGLQGEAAADAIREHGPTGIVCCNDTYLVWAAEIAEPLGLPFFSRETAVGLTDKLAQRRALRSHGLPTPDFWDADELAADPAPDDVVRAAGYPLVLKPRQGRASQDVEPIRSPEQLRELLAAAEPGRMLVEGFIPDPTSAAQGTGSAPYVSVELVASDGAISVLGVTGRPPLAPPFRETGVIFPADLPQDRRDEVIAAAVDAARALGVETGPLHIEVKLTDAGPVVIEVNGVMGGGAIRDLIRHALGIDVLQLAMRIAAREHIEFDEPPRPADVGFLFEIQPDADAKQILTIDGLDGVADIPGVERVIPGLRAGDECTWRAGTPGFIAGIFGSAPDHAAAYRIREEFDDRVVVTVRT
ncbi:ATP-grasp domain-containing protein [Humibacter sp.]|jgi:biotin carboxylase|uniref:ATP-grasp domain-containing protein n=1 Tax=Humibacter sp. TaxID=1940291 RepID=UPI002C234328|nr:ATP-grasp domain-containing protein [Humibacter sp.]HVX09501.1 ATP-grasp domain-containing protein [Humibacter sp.]